MCFLIQSFWDDIILHILQVLYLEGEVLLPHCQIMDLEMKYYDSILWVIMCGPNLDSLVKLWIVSSR